MSSQDETEPTTPAEGTPEDESATSSSRPWLKDAASEGGRAVAAKHGSEHMARIGRAGANAVMRKYGLRYYSEIAARNRGVKKRRSTESG